MFSCTRLCLFASFAIASGADPERARVIIEVTADHHIEAQKPIELDLNFTELMRQVGIKGRFHERSLDVVAADKRSRQVLWQFDRAANYDAAKNALGTLTALLPAAIEPGGAARLTVQFGLRPAAGKPSRKPESLDVVNIAGELVHQGQISIKIDTPTATYLYHKEGAGFASLLDRDGNDWISFRPGGGSAGEYRGIPNLGAFAHPGYKGEEGTVTEVEGRGPARVRLRSATRDGRSATVWDIFPRYARLTVVKTADPYWFLYEGTPGGKLDVDGDFVVTSKGLRRTVSQSWSGDLPSPEWVYFGDAKLNRILFLVNHQDDNHEDQFWQMQGNMTVFGFGRQYRCCGRYLTANPGVFTIGLAETSDFNTARDVIESAWQPVKLKVGKPELAAR